LSAPPDGSTTCAGAFTEAGRPSGPGLQNPDPAAQGQTLCGDLGSCGQGFCLAPGEICCIEQGYPGRVCPLGQVCTADGRCSTDQACRGKPFNLQKPCTVQADCRNPYVALDCDQGTCRQMVAQSFCEDDSWCASPLRCNGDTCADNTPTSSVDACNLCGAYGGTQATNHCGQGAVDCSGGAGTTCCPAAKPFFINGDCYATALDGCHAAGGVCPSRCIF
jgi:hypothetical protein